MTAALEGCEWSAARPGRTLPLGKTRYPFYRRLGRPQGRSWRVEYLVHTGIWSRTIQPVVSRYTDWATWPTQKEVWLTGIIDLCIFIREGMSHIKIKLIWRIIVIPCTGHLLLFCTKTNKCTIISQIVTLLHVSTLSCHPQGACNQYLAKLHKYFKCSCW